MQPQSRPSAQPQTRPAVGPRAAGEHVTFTTDDNVLLVGGYTRPLARKGERAPVAILLHMYASDRQAFEPLTPALHAAGFAVLAIDLRGHGDSAGPVELGLSRRVADRDPKLFADMYKDVEAGYRWLADRPELDMARFTLVGASVGGSIALDYASRDKSVDAVVWLTPGTSYLGIDSVADAQKYGRRPLLLMAAEPERAAADDLGHIVPGATVKTLPYGGPDPQGLHGTRMFGKALGVERNIADFLVKAVGPASAEVVVGSTHGQVYYPVDASSAQQLSKDNRRLFSSPEEAEARGLRAPKSGAGRSSRSWSSPRKPVPSGEAFPDKP
jgi:dienelactone hydrolase